MVFPDTFTECSVTKLLGAGTGGSWDSFLGSCAMRDKEKKKMIRIAVCFIKWQKWCEWANGYITILETNIAM